MHSEQEVLRQKARADRFKDQLASAPAATAKGGSDPDFEAKKKVTTCTSISAVLLACMWCELSVLACAGQGGAFCCKDMTGTDSPLFALASHEHVASVVHCCSACFNIRPNKAWQYFACKDMTGMDAPLFALASHGHDASIVHYCLAHFNIRRNKARQ